MGSLSPKQKIQINITNEEEDSVFPFPPPEITEANSISSDNNDDNDNDNSSDMITRIRTIHRILRRSNQKIERKYLYDCLRKKIKHLVLIYFLAFINGKIKATCDKIKKIEDNQIKNTKINFEKKFMYETLGDIFSAPISKLYSINIVDRETHNKNLIKKLRSENELLNKILNIKFIECLNHFMGKKSIEELEGMQTFENITINGDENYKKCLYCYAFDYENIILKSKPK